MKVGNGLQNRRKNGKNSYSRRLLLDFHNGGQMKKQQKDILYSLHATIICPYCLKPIEPAELTKDHEPPLSRGGKRDQWVYACKKCNNTKGSLTADEFLEWKRLEHLRNGGR